ncbi:MAG TPA: hypothetical protein DDW48_06770, partial [Methyloceanibacter sp.]|nr:hypothetical protein [Methyloceanibacter sp.]
MEREATLRKTFGDLRRQLARWDESRGTRRRAGASRNAPPCIARIHNEAERIGGRSERERGHLIYGPEQK